MSQGRQPEVGGGDAIRRVSARGLGGAGGSVLRQRSRKSGFTGRRSRQVLKPDGSREPSTHDGHGAVQTSCRHGSAHRVGYGLRS